MMNRKIFIQIISIVRYNERLYNSIPSIHNYMKNINFRTMHTSS